ncbi:NUDIX domain-containing protein [Paenibacillus sp. 1011MAR3C5]|uniref:NUDIX domain-containing protein n=1 Tax=Paenibacillus sp. 1011MAR3C5 TaxID=1675787 RepID=UPI0016017892|nr:NUDIX domain-containing protein [Paenibacillus sp. 1011MAR3C5]
MATAFLFHNDSVLMMKKVKPASSTDVFWTGLGGHLEPYEWNSPKSACLREIFEESGIKEHEVEGLTLRYILLRIKEHEIRQQFVYFGTTEQTNWIESAEGELHWVHRDEVLHLQLSRIIHYMIKHYNDHPHHKAIMIGTIARDTTDEPFIQWAELTDPIIF